MSERSEREIRESIENTRARMGETIEQIGDRVNPDRVKAELKARARDQIDGVKDNMKRKARNTMRDVEHGVTGTGRGIWATIRQNPVPAGMVGVGLAWLLANRRDSGADRYDYDTYSTGPAVPYRAGYTQAVHRGSSRGYAEESTSYGDLGTAAGYGAAGFQGETRSGVSGAYGVGGTSGFDRDLQDRTNARNAGFEAGAARGFSEDGRQESHGLREKASNAIHQAGDRLGETRERVGEAMHGTRERAGEMVHNTQHRVSSWASGAKDRAQHRVEDSLRENPMAAGAMALAIGAVAGMMIPESDREHEVMGRTRDRVLDRAQDAVRRSAANVHDAAREAAADSARSAVDGVWPGADETQTEGFSEPRR